MIAQFGEAVTRAAAAGAGALAAMVLIFASGPVAQAAPDTPRVALSEIKEATPEPDPDAPPASSPADPFPGTTVPLPDPITRQPLPEPGAEEPDVVEPAPETSPGPDRPVIAEDEPLPEVMYDLAKLPAPTRRMWELITEACRAGDIEALRPLIGLGADITQLSLGGIEGDPVDFLREMSGDGQGQEILAILLEVLESGFVHLDAGTPQEAYVWPYFFATPLDRLDARQRVELFKVVTAGDYEDMKAFGAYNFYRVGINPEGRWLFFVAGD